MALQLPYRLHRCREQILRSVDQIDHGGSDMFNLRKSIGPMWRNLPEEIVRIGIISNQVSKSMSDISTIALTILDALRRTSPVLAKRDELVPVLRNDIAQQISKMEDAISELSAAIQPFRENASAAAADDDDDAPPFIDSDQAGTDDSLNRQQVNTIDDTGMAHAITEQQVDDVASDTHTTEPDHLEKKLPAAAEPTFDHAEAVSTVAQVAGQLHRDTASSLSPLTHDDTNILVTKLPAQRKDPEDVGKTLTSEPTSDTVGISMAAVDSVAPVDTEHVDAHLNLPADFHLDLEREEHDDLDKKVPAISSVLAESPLQHFHAPALPATDIANPHESTEATHESVATMPSIKRVRCCEDEYCILPPGRDAFVGCKCNHCDRWVHELCVAMKYRAGDVKCNTCYKRGNAKWRPESSRAWRERKQKYAEKPDVDFPAGVLPFDPKDQNQFHIAEYNLEVFDLAEKFSDTTSFRYRLKVQDLKRKYELDSTPDEQSDSGHSVARAPPVDSGNVSASTRARRKRTSEVSVASSAQKSRRLSGEFSVSPSQDTAILVAIRTGDPDDAFLLLSKKDDHTGEFNIYREAVYSSPYYLDKSSWRCSPEVWSGEITTQNRLRDNMRLMPDGQLMPKDLLGIAVKMVRKFRDIASGDAIFDMTSPEWKAKHTGKPGTPPETYQSLYQDIVKKAEEDIRERQR